LTKELWHKCKATNFKSRALLSKYKNSKKLFNVELKNSIKEFEFSLVRDKHNPKKLFEYINRRQSVDKSINSIRDSNGEIVTAGIEISNILNNYFRSVFVLEDNSHQPEFICPKSITKQMPEMFTISPELIEQYLLN
jgi:hypothetical protein